MNFLFRQVARLFGLGKNAVRLLSAVVRTDAGRAALTLGKHAIRLARQVESLDLPGTAKRAKVAKGLLDLITTGTVVLPGGVITSTAINLAIELAVALIKENKDTPDLQED